MKQRFPYLIAATFVAVLVIAGCSQAPPASTPPTQPTNAAIPAAVPTEATEAAKTAEPAKKVDYPTGPVIVTVGWSAGGGNDLAARVLASGMEKVLNVPFQIVNKPGAAGQIAISELAKAKPDGYTLTVTPLPTTNTIYLDPNKKATFTRKDLAPIALYSLDPVVVAVKADGPYKTLKDLIDDAKANPKKVRVGTSALMALNHLAVLELERVTGAEFAVVPFEGGGENSAALVGGHVDASFDLSGSLMAQVKSGAIRVIGVMDNAENKYLPGAPTMESQGYKIYMSSARGWSAPAGTPTEIVHILEDAVKKVVESEEFQVKMDEMGLGVRYMNSAEFSKFWDETDVLIKPLLDRALAEQAK